MPYCTKCGTEVDINAQYCPKCGSPQGARPYQPAYQRPVDPNDSDSIGWAVLGFFLPIVGLILYLVWAQTRPNSAKLCGMGALVGVLAEVIFSVVYVMAFVVIMSDSTSPGLLFF